MQLTPHEIATKINTKFLDTFEYKNGSVEHALLLLETPYTYFVQFNEALFGTIYKDELIGTALVKRS
jgi:hypothetical protein